MFTLFMGRANAIPCDDLYLKFYVNDTSRSSHHISKSFTALLAEVRVKI